MSFSVFRYSKKVALTKEEVRRRLEGLIKDFSDKRFVEQYIRYNLFVDYSGRVYEDRFRLTRYTYTPVNYRFWLLFSELSIIEGTYHPVGDRVMVKFQVVANEFYAKLLRILLGFVVVFTAVAYYQQMDGLIFSAVWIVGIFVAVAFLYMTLFYFYSRWRFNQILAS